MRLLIASHNEGKLTEFRQALAGLGLTLLPAHEAGLDQFPIEEGTSYEENAFMKAAYAATRTGLPALGDDSGLEVEALGGAPGIYSARFGGDLSSGERMAYLLRQVYSAPSLSRAARFVCVLTLATPAGQVRTFHGECRGELLEGPRGAGGFGYDPIFYSPELGKTFAEASASEKERASHRGRAVRALRNWLAEGDNLRLLTQRRPAPGSV